MKRLSLAGAVFAVALFAVAGSAWAEASTRCVKATKTTTKPKHYTGAYSDKNCTAASATHQGKYEFLKPSLLSEPEQEEVKALLKYVKVVPSGIDSKPTVRVSAANVQIVNGEGKTGQLNGEGNLVIGYDEEPGVQTGSHNLVLNDGQSFTNFGSLIAGHNNKASGQETVVFGGHNTASGTSATVTGGSSNVASGTEAAVSGGINNTASMPSASVTGGSANNASGNTSSISGGEGNHAEAQLSSIFGGKGLKASAEFEALPACIAPGTAGELC